MAQPVDGVPIKELTFEQLQEITPKIDGWIYPRRGISAFIPLFSVSQQAAISFYGWIAIVIVIGSVVLPLIGYSGWLLALLPGAIVVWKANRNSIEQFFLQNLRQDAAFYDAIRQSDLGQRIEVVLR